MLIGLAFLYYVRSIIELDISSFNINLKKIDFYLIILSLFFYTLSHILRGFRLYIIADDVSISFSKLLNLQFKANSVNLLFPFKLGEAYRILSFSKILGGNLKSIITLIIERFFDILILFILLSFGTFISDQIQIKDIYYLYFPLVILMLILFTIISIGEDSIILFQKRLLEKNNSDSIGMLKFSTKILNNISEIKNLVQKKVKHITILSFIIWGFEIMTLLIFFKIIGFQIDVLILLGVYIAFSSLLPNGPIGIGGLQLSFFYIFSIFNIEQEFISISYIYGIVIFGYGVALGFILLLKDLIIKFIIDEKRQANN